MNFIFWPEFFWEIIRKDVMFSKKSQGSSTRMFFELLLSKQFLEENEAHILREKKVFLFSIRRNAEVFNAHHEPNENSRKCNRSKPFHQGIPLIIFVLKIFF
jgi:hypothetical protein